MFVFLQSKLLSKKQGEIKINNKHIGIIFLVLGILFLLIYPLIYAMAVAFDSAEVTSTTFVVLAFVFLLGPVNFLLTGYAFLKAKRWVRWPLILLIAVSLFLTLFHLATVLGLVVYGLFKGTIISTKLFLLSLYSSIISSPITLIGVVLAIFSVYSWRYVSHHKEDFNN